MKTYNTGLCMEWIDVPLKSNGQTDIDAAKGLLDEKVAGFSFSIPQVTASLRTLVPLEFPNYWKRCM